ncbi:BadF/BadG/BcrA/BcrD ATPase family protein [Streptomyces sp. DG2A-72]|uniref:N-acetylglucosamine kinase n=1 Tax=Streptomyces sp. DG2A-72 TaxID=3051386 RepID=UPI00265BC20F|nr:BadF/BadG/BcrA/BcrD ATPase family protein [Streptomyces sp. DG2A-72]MDO0938408.1 BadF/BadG/BcrA/BcrD ATPase family protein [Streptomyces sp. DG2A-72]
MNNNLNQDLVVGLDVGGTRTRAVLASAHDSLPHGEGTGGPGNALTVPVPELTDHLAEAVAQAVPEPLRDRVGAVAGGFAGASRTAADEPGRLRAQSALSAALGRLGIHAVSVEIYSDIEAAFASAPGFPADGLALVAGTGAVAARITRRRCTATAGGDGWLLGDDGSGFWIGRSAVRAALRMADGRGGPTLLAASVVRELGLPAEVLPYGDQEWTREQREVYRMHVLPAVMAGPPVQLARLAPLVVEAAGDKDAVAEAILQEAADRLTDTLRALDPHPGERIVVTGGLIDPLLTPLSDRLPEFTIDQVADGCPGAVALARLGLGR